MATLSCSDIGAVALLIVASVSFVHTAARPFIPNVRPLNCAFCLAFWASLGFAAAHWSIESLAVVPVAGFFAVVAAGLWPWAFHSTPVPPA